MTALITTQEKNRRSVLARGPKGSVGREELKQIEKAEAAKVLPVIRKSPSSAKVAVPVRKHVAGLPNIVHAENVIREERARLKAILSSRPYGDEQAEFLAYSTEISAEVAVGILSIH
jgi:hypothetical protein